MRSHYTIAKRKQSRNRKIAFRLVIPAQAGMTGVVFYFEKLKIELENRNGMKLREIL